MLPRSPSSFTPFPDGRYLLMGPDADADPPRSHQVLRQGRRSAAEIRGDAAPRRRLHRADAGRRRRPNPWSGRPGDLWQLAKLGLAFRKLGKDGAAADRNPDRRGAGRSSTAGSSRSNSRRRWPPTRSSARWPSPSMPGTAYVLFHHVMGECNGVRGVWGYVRGGMGGISQRAGRSRPRRTAPRFARNARGRPAS